MYLRILFFHASCIEGFYMAFLIKKNLIKHNNDILLEFSLVLLLFLSCFESFFIVLE